jgi:hypothetical protein
VDPDRFVARFPRLYHMADFGSWPSIERHGLLSTTALLDLFEIVGEQRDSIEARWRPASVVIEHPEHGRAVIRDQLPLRPDLLRRCLTDGLAPADWYRTLNGHVFFWADRPHLETLVHARAYRDFPQTVIIVDTARLLARYLDRVRLSSINSGSIIRGGALRGPNTFRSIQEHASYRVVELCVAGGVTALLDAVVSAEHVWPDGRIEVLHRTEPPP